MKGMKLPHIGIVMTQPDRVQRFMEKFDLEEDYTEYVEAYQADCIFMRHREDDSAIELVVPKEGILTEYNNGKGGIHHIAFEVEDVSKVREEFEAKGLKMLEERAVKGAGDIIVNFLRPRHGEGILVEFVEKIKKM